MADDRTWARSTDNAHDLLKYSAIGRARSGSVNLRFEGIDAAVGNC
jgi:hypothetical protein